VIVSSATVPTASAAVVTPAVSSTTPASRSGPKTAAGKAAVSQNARTHGVLSTAPVIPGVETEDEWRAYRDGLFNALLPENAFEEALAGRAVRLFWRLRRVERYETESAALASHSDALAPDRLLPAPDALERVMRYEAHLHRQLTTVLHELEAAQTRRRGGATPLARLDVSAFAHLQPPRYSGPPPSRAVLPTLRPQ
jgi:hypothetical protein